MAKKRKPPQEVTPESYINGVPLCATCGNWVPEIRDLCCNCYETRGLADYLDEEKELEND